MLVGDKGITGTNVPQARGDRGNARVSCVNCQQTGNSSGSEEEASPRPDPNEASH